MCADQDGDHETDAHDKAEREAAIKVTEDRYNGKLLQINPNLSLLMLEGLIPTPPREFELGCAFGPSYVL